MNHFPQELVDQICSHLDSEDLRSTYYVSSTFRKAAEEHAGKYRTRHMPMAKENNQRIIDYFSGFRLRYLDTVDFSTSFPDLEFDGDAQHCYEGADELREKDRIFTKQIQDLFATLKMLDERAGERNYGKYKLTIFSPTQRRLGTPCYDRNHDQWRTHLLEPETLPDLVSVVSLEIRTNRSEAKLDYRVLIDLITRCPNLESFKCHTGCYEWTPCHDEEPASDVIWDYGGPRRDTRHDFAKAITSTNIPKSLQRVEFDFFSSVAMREADRIDHRWAMPNLVGPASKDPFSTSLRILSYYLQELRLRVQADETLFWPEDNSTPIWPHLQRVFIMLHMVSPSGAWYFEGLRGEGRRSAGYEINDSSYPPLGPEIEFKNQLCSTLEGESARSFEGVYSFWFRISPNNNILGPFLTSFAKAAANMPDLRQAILWSPLRWCLDGVDDDVRGEFEYFQPPEIFYEECMAWGLAYCIPGESSPFKANPGQLQCDTRQIWWKVGEWRPSPDIHGLFQQIGCQKHGEALKEYWDDDKFGQGWVPRHYFQWSTPDG